MNHAQLLKAYGHLPLVALRDVAAFSAEDALASMLGFLKDRFCAHPDFMDDEIADAKPEDVCECLGLEPEFAADLIAMHRAMRAATRETGQTGSGSWPPACKTEYPGRHAFTYFVEQGWSSNWTRPVKDTELQELIDPKVWPFTEADALKMWSGKPMYEVALLLMERSWFKRGVATIRVQDRSKANVVIRNIPIPGSTIGYAYFNNRSCSDQVTCNIDSGWGPSLHGAANLLTHETGHNNNLQHTFAGESVHHGIMSYSPQYPFKGFRPGPPVTVLPQDPSIPVLNRYYGDEPISYPGTDVPPPPPPPSPTESTAYWMQKTGIGFVIQQNGAVVTFTKLINIGA